VSTRQLIYMPGHIKMYICLSVGQLTGYAPVHWQILQCSIFFNVIGVLGEKWAQTVFLQVRQC